jgi:hypothetical protein
VSVREPVIVDCGCGRDHPSMPTENGVELICRTHKRHHPCRKCAHERKAPPVSVREQAIEAATKAIDDVRCQHWDGAAACTPCDAAAALAAAVPVLLNDLADRIAADPDEAFNPALDRAARLVRAAAEGWTE